MKEVTENVLKIAYFIDSPISLMVFLGAFLILMATLTFVLNPTNPAHRPDPLPALLVVLGTQIFFGAAGIGTQHFVDVIALVCHRTLFASS